MSRTIRGEKSGGTDFWSRRPASGRGTGPVPKGICHRTERQQARGDVRKGIEEVANAAAD